MLFTVFDGQNVAPPSLGTRKIRLHCTSNVHLATLAPPAGLIQNNSGGSDLELGGGGGLDPNSSVFIIQPIAECQPKGPHLHSPGEITSAVQLRFHQLNPSNSTMIPLQWACCCRYRWNELKYLKSSFKNWIRHSEGLTQVETLNRTLLCVGILQENWSRQQQWTLEFCLFSFTLLSLYVLYSADAS